MVRLIRNSGRFWVTFLRTSSASKCQRLNGDTRRLVGIGVFLEGVQFLVDHHQTDRQCEENWEERKDEMPTKEIDLWARPSLLIKNNSSRSVIQTQKMIKRSNRRTIRGFFNPRLCKNTAVWRGSMAMRDGNQWRTTIDEDKRDGRHWQRRSSNDVQTKINETSEEKNDWQRINQRDPEKRKINTFDELGRIRRDYSRSTRRKWREKRREAEQWFFVIVVHRKEDLSSQHTSDDRQSERIRQGGERGGEEKHCSSSRMCEDVHIGWLKKSQFDHKEKDTLAKRRSVSEDWSQWKESFWEGSSLKTRCGSRRIHFIGERFVWKSWKSRERERSGKKISSMDRKEGNVLWDADKSIDRMFFPVRIQRTQTEMNRRKTEFEFFFFFFFFFLFLKTEWHSARSGER